MKTLMRLSSLHGHGLIALAAAFAFAAGATQAQDRAGHHSTQTAAGPQGVASDRISIRDRSELPQCPNQGPVVIAPCAADEMLVLFDQPVYDNQGLFVICLEKTPYCLPSDLDPAGGPPAGVDGVTMREMLARFHRGGHTPPPAIVDLAGRTGTGDPLADTTITCNDTTNICTCVSDQDGDCEAKLSALCTTADPFGSNGGVGTDCPTVVD